MMAPVLDYEEAWNRDHRAAIVSSQEMKDIMKNKMQTGTRPCMIQNTYS